MTVQPDSGSAVLAMDVVAEAAGVLSGASFDDVLRKGPALVLGAVPEASSVQLSVQWQGGEGPRFSRAERGTSLGCPATPSAADTLSLRVATHDGWAWGDLLVMASAGRTISPVSALTTELLAVQVEQAWGMAHLRDVISGLQLSLVEAREVGVALGMSIMGDLGAGADFELLKGLEPDARLALAWIAEDLTRAKAAKALIPRLRLVAGEDPLSAPAR